MKIEKFESEIKNKDKEIDRLNKIINTTKEDESVKELDEIEDQILQFFYDKDREITSEEVSQGLPMDIRKVKYHINNLLKIGYIELPGIVGHWITKEQEKYIITEPGRAYIIQKQP